MTIFSLPSICNITIQAWVTHLSKEKNWKKLDEWRTCRQTWYFLVVEGWAFLHASFFVYQGFSVRLNIENSEGFQHCGIKKTTFKKLKAERVATMWQAEATGPVCFSWRVGDCWIIWPECDSSPSLKIPLAWMAVCAHVRVHLPVYVFIGKTREERWTEWHLFEYFSFAARGAFISCSGVFVLPQSLKWVTVPFQKNVGRAKCRLKTWTKKMSICSLFMLWLPFCGSEGNGKNIPEKKEACGRNKELMQGSDWRRGGGRGGASLGWVTSAVSVHNVWRA